MPFLSFQVNILRILYVAMSLKVNGVKNVRTLPKWQGTDGFRISVDELRKAFILEEYNRYALLNERVLQVAKRELKLYDLGNVMFILNSPKNEKAEPLKCYVSNCSEIP
jgi:hypothetical protein